MSFISFFVSFIFFLIAALTAQFEWKIGDVNPTEWGLVFFALGHFLGGGVAYFRERVK